MAGITGVVSIDANGDRNADYSLLDMNPETENFEVFCQRFTSLNNVCEYVSQLSLIRANSAFYPQREGR